MEPSALPTQTPIATPLPTTLPLRPDPHGHRHRFYRHHDFRRTTCHCGRAGCRRLQHHDLHDAASALAVDAPGQTLDLYQRAMASTARIFDVIDTPIHIVDGVQSLPVESVRGDVRFETVEFAYDPSVPVLQGLSIDVPAGQTAAFVGATGAGKSTIIKLLLRFMM